LQPRPGVKAASPACPAWVGERLQCLLGRRASGLTRAAGEGSTRLAHFGKKQRARAATAATLHWS
jgi:hypothetical protein